ncbi:hypothetical protein FKM82_011015 [Ascaphus truei]
MSHASRATAVVFASFTAASSFPRAWGLLRFSLAGKNPLRGKQVRPHLYALVGCESLYNDSRSFIRNSTIHMYIYIYTYTHRLMYN